MFSALFYHPVQNTKLKLSQGNTGLGGHPSLTQLPNSQSDWVRRAQSNMRAILLWSTICSHSERRWDVLFSHFWQFPWPSALIGHWDSELLGWKIWHIYIVVASFTKKAIFGILFACCLLLSGFPHLTWWLLAGPHILVLLVTEHLQTLPDSSWDSTWHKGTDSSSVSNGWECQNFGAWPLASLVVSLGKLWLWILPSRALKCNCQMCYTILLTTAKYHNQVCEIKKAPCQICRGPNLGNGIIFDALDHCESQ